MRYLIWMLVLSAGFTGLSAAAADRFEGLPDPTRPSGWRVDGAPSTGVQSILISPQRKVAVVHGRSVTVGDRVGDAVVVDIRPYEVILKRAGRESSLRLVPRLGTLASGGG